MDSLTRGLTQPEMVLCWCIWVCLTCEAPDYIGPSKYDANPFPLGSSVSTLGVVGSNGRECECAKPNKEKPCDDCED